MAILMKESLRAKYTSMSQKIQDAETIKVINALKKDTHQPKKSGERILYHDIPTLKSHAAKHMVLSDPESNINKNIYSKFSKDERSQLPGPRGDRVMKLPNLPLISTKGQPKQVATSYGTLIISDDGRAVRTRNNIITAWESTRKNLNTPGPKHRSVNFLRENKIKARLGKESYPDGACMFSTFASLAEIHGYGKTNAKELRRIAVKEMRNPRSNAWKALNTDGILDAIILDIPKEDAKYKVKDVESYLQYMSSNSVWGTISSYKH